MSLRGGTCEAGDDKANLEQPSVALVIVCFVHNYALEEKVHAVNFMTNTVRPDCHVALRAPLKEQQGLANDPRRGSVPVPLFLLISSWALGGDSWSVVRNEICRPGP